MLHLDLWWNGVNVLRDSGSFAYYDPEAEWNRYFLSAAAHNTLTAAGVDQMVKGPRFQWYSLVQSRFIGRWTGEGVELWLGEHYGYRRLPTHVVHRRAVCRIDDRWWLIIDDVMGEENEELSLHWHLPDDEYDVEDASVRLRTRGGACRIHLFSLADQWEWEVIRGGDRPGDRAGWDSLYYGVRKPAPTIRVRTHSRLPARFATVVGLGISSAPAEVDLARVIRWRSDQEPAEWSVGLARPEAGIIPVTSFERDGYTCELGS
jgi:hypothetical protein